MNGYIVILYQVITSVTSIPNILVIITITESAAVNYYSGFGVEPAVILTKLLPIKTRYCLEPVRKLYYWA